jgi:hypothetical protein
MASMTAWVQGLKLNLKAKFEGGSSYFSFKCLDQGSGYDRVNLHHPTWVTARLRLMRTGSSSPCPSPSVESRLPTSRNPARQ